MAHFSLKISISLSILITILFSVVVYFSFYLFSDDDTPLGIPYSIFLKTNMYNDFNLSKKLNFMILLEPYLRLITIRACSVGMAPTKVSGSTISKVA